MALFGESVGQIQSIVGEIMNVEHDNDDKFVQSMALYHMAVAVFSDDSLCKFLKLLARLPVFSRDFEELLSQKSNLECLNILKKLKFYVNLKIRETLYLLTKLSVAYGDEDGADNLGVMLTKYYAGVNHGMDAASAVGPIDMVDLKFKDAVRQDVLFGTAAAAKRAEYLAEFEELEKVEPHAVYPTSIYRQSDGYTVATESSHKIEAVMSTTLSASIRISSHVLGFDNNHLAEIYRPLGRAVIVLDDKLDDATYTLGPVDLDTNRRINDGDEQKNNMGRLTIRQQMERYFDFHGVMCNVLTRSGNEVDKDIESVQQILFELKKLGVMRNEPVLIVGGVSAKFQCLNCTGMYYEFLCTVRILYAHISYFVFI